MHKDIFFELGTEGVDWKYISDDDPTEHIISDEVIKVISKTAVDEETRKSLLRDIYYLNLGVEIIHDVSVLPKDFS